jgi:DNA-binding transcriptional LysR family regulator
MAQPLDWNDIRIFLAVADTGSTLQASRALGVSQSTVSRRIAAMEEAIRLRLFEKRRTGYALSESGRHLLETARTTAKAMLAFEMQAAAQKRGLAGTVRLTASDAFADYLLDRAVSEFRLEFPSIQVEIVSSAKRLDLANGDADIALRAGPRPHEPDLVGRRIAEDTWSLYCSRAYASEHGVPRTPADLASHRVIGVAAGNSATPLVAWLEDNVPESAIFMRRSSIEGILSSIANSTGVSLMSDFLASADPQLVRCFSPNLGSIAEIWLLTHERLRDVPRVRAVLDFLHAYFAEGRHIRNNGEAD